MSEAPKTYRRPSVSHQQVDPYAEFLTQPNKDPYAEFLPDTTKHAPSQQRPKQKLPESTAKEGVVEGLRFLKNLVPTSGSELRELVEDASRTIYPSVDSMEGPAGKAWGAARDLATLIPRTAAGVGAGLGSAFGEATRKWKPGEGSLPDVEAGLAAFQQTMRSPSKTAEETGGMLERVGASMAEDPMTLPGTYFGAGNTLATTMLKGVPVGIATYGTHVADRAASGRDDAFSGETKSQLFSDVAPVVMPAALRLAKATVSAIPLGKIPQFLGESGKKKAVDLAMSQFKAAPQYKGGQEWEGLKEALESSYQGKPLITQLFTGKESKIPQVVENYKLLKAEVDKHFEPIMDEMTKAGITIPQKKILEKVYKDIDEYLVNEAAMPAWSKTKIGNAKDWISSIINRHVGDAKLQAFSEAMAEGKVDPAVYVGPMGHLDTRKFNALAGLGAINPSEYKPLYRFPDGSLKPKAAAFDYDPLTPKAAHTSKGAAYKEAYKRSAEQETEKEYAAASLGRVLRESMTDPEFLKPQAVINAEAGKGGLNPLYVKMLKDKFYNERVPAILKWKEQLAKSQPFYAAEPAMLRAEHTTANRSPLGLGVLASNPVAAIPAWLQSRPSTVNTLYNIGEDSKVFEKLFQKAGKVGKVLPSPVKGTAKALSSFARDPEYLGLQSRLATELLKGLDIKALKQDATKTKK